MNVERVVLPSTRLIIYLHNPFFYSRLGIVNCHRRNTWKLERTIQIQLHTIWTDDENKTLFHLIYLSFKVKKKKYDGKWGKWRNSNSERYLFQAYYIQMKSIHLPWAHLHKVSTHPLVEWVANECKFRIGDSFCFPFTKGTAFHSRGFLYTKFNTFHYIIVSANPEARTDSWEYVANGQKRYW